MNKVYIIKTWCPKTRITLMRFNIFQRIIINVLSSFPTYSFYILIKFTIYNSFVWNKVPTSSPYKNLDTTPFRKHWISWSLFLYWQVPAAPILSEHSASNIRWAWTLDIFSHVTKTVLRYFFITASLLSSTPSTSLPAPICEAFNVIAICGLSCHRKNRGAFILSITTSPWSTE